MSQQLTWLTYTTFFTAVLWVPYILEAFITHGIMGTMGNPQDRKKASSPWAVRAKAAHANAVENLIIIAALVLIAEFARVDVASYVMIYFFARIVHAIVYALGIPGLRTVCFLTGFAMQVMIFVALI